MTLAWSLAMIRAMRHVVVPVTAIRFALSAHRGLLLEMLALHHQVAVLYIDETGLMRMSRILATFVKPCASA